jgi:hypothetical protein
MPVPNRYADRYQWDLADRLRAVCGKCSLPGAHLARWDICRMPGPNRCVAPFKWVVWVVLVVLVAWVAWVAWVMWVVGREFL